MVEGILLEGFIYGIMTLGVFITFRVLDFPDLTVDGSFPLGAAVMAAMLTGGAHPITAVFVAFCGGLIAGFVTAVIHNKLQVPNLLAGILTMTMLYSVNIRVMGNNEQMVITQGVNPEYLKIIGVGLSNGIVAISGAFAALDPKNAEIILRLTDEYIREYNLTAMMVTHNMSQAIEYGNRLIMMNKGKIILDIFGEEKQELTVEKLVEKFHAVSKETLDSDEVRLA